MALDFIPQPQKVTSGPRCWAGGRGATIGVSGHELFSVARSVRELIGGGEIGVAVRGVSYDVTVALDGRVREGGYKLSVSEKGIVIRAHSVAAASHAVQTLRQVAAQSPRGKLRHVVIDDWPDFPDRAIYHDVARGRVPKLATLKELADRLSRVKINQLQLYIEHTFKFRRHPSIGRNASPLTAEDIMELDEYCRERHVELVPSLAAFGHMGRVICHEEYHHLAEGCDVGDYGSLAPANPKTYVFLKELFDEFLPCFSSNRFNVCCDEVWNLGEGQSKKLAEKMGKGPLYLQHICKLRNLAAGHGKKIMMWGDIIRHYPKLIPKIPKDVTCLDWTYTSQAYFDRIKDFTDTGLDSYVCPSVSGYRTLFPRIYESMGNIAGWALAGKKHGARGMLNTDWGDGGHYNFVEYAWLGYLYSAERSWHAKADGKSFLRRFAKLFLGIESPDFVRALEALGKISDLETNGFYQSFWRHVYFASVGDGLHKPVEREFRAYKNGKYVIQKRVVRADMGKVAAKTLAGVRSVFGDHFKRTGADPNRVGDYWLFAVDALAHAADKVATLGEGGKDTPANRRRLKRDMTKLRDRFKKLWMARNRRSEIHITLGHYDRAIRSL